MTRSPGRSTRSPEPGDPLSDAEYRALGEFRRGLREFFSYSESGAAEHDISSQQHQALLAIRAHTGPEAMSVGELAECLMIKHHSAVGLVDRMVEGGLVVRLESQVDRRRVLLGLTPEGRRILSAISLRNLERLSSTGKVLSSLVRTVRRLERRGLWRSPGPEGEDG